MKANYPDNYEVALGKALHERGLRRANFIAGLETENMELRRFLLRAKPHLPANLLQELSQFFDESKAEEKAKEP